MHRMVWVGTDQKDHPDLTALTQAGTPYTGTDLSDPHPAQS